MLELKYHEREWLALTLTPGLGPTRARKLLQHFADVGQVFSASLTELEGAGLKAVSAQSIGSGASLALADTELEKVQAASVHLLGFDSPQYPQRLKQIYDPPLVLYARGNIEILDQLSLAMGGTRHPTPYGLGMAERLACDLSARGFIIIERAGAGS